MPLELTLLIFLKDRALFTKRLCDCLSKIKYPYPVYFADGSLAQDNEQLFNTLENQNFSYTYKRYPPDLSLLDYYKKCNLSIKEVKTPYVMLIDNDDFPILEGQEEALQFLKRNSEFIGCNGRVSGFTISPDSSLPYGKNFLFHRYYSRAMDVPVPIDQDLSLDRIDAYLKNFYSIFYSVFKKEVLMNTFSKIEDLNPSDLGICELFFSYLCLAQGKIYSINKITYLRQKGSSQVALTQKDWFHRLFHTNWLNDSQRALKEVADYISTTEDTSSKKCYEILYDQLINRIRKRYITNEFYLLKNVDSIFLNQNILEILLNKIFKKCPLLGEKLSLKFCLNRDEQDIRGIKELKKIIAKN